VRVDEIDVEAEFAGPASPENQLALSYLGPLAGKRVLDAGCGYGVASVYFALHGATVTSLDISPEMLSRTRELAQRYRVSHAVATLECPLESLAEDLPPYDLAYGYGVLHHLPLESGLQAVRRSLRPGGVGVFVEPLGLNPLVNAYRRISPGVRTSGERPLGLRDLRTVRRVFPQSVHAEAQLCAMAVYVLLVLFGRLNLDRDRLWKLLYEPRNARLARWFRRACRFDRWLLKQVPLLGVLSWATVIKVTKDTPD